MAPIQVLPLSPQQQQPSFGSLLGQQLGGGIGQGISSSLQSYLENKQKNQQIQNLLSTVQKMRTPQVQEGMEADSEGSQPLISQEQQPFSPRELSTDQIAAVSMINKPLGDLLAKEAEQTQKRKEKFEERAFRKSEKYLDKLGEEQRGLVKKDIALKQMRTALESGEFSGIRNALADYTGLEFLKSAPAQAVNSAIKEYLISDLGSITGRPNQFIEKQLSQALVNPQFKEEANQAILLGLEGLNNLKKREIEIANDLEERFLNKGMEIPRNFQNLVDKKLQKEAQQFENEYQQKINSLFGGKTALNKGTQAINPKTGETLIWTGKEWKARK